MNLRRGQTPATYCGRCGVWVAPDKKCWDMREWYALCSVDCPGPSRFDPKPKEKGKPW